ncbi:cytoplasmic dynein 2 light intermediate chain 1-like [Oppia nitens]|uniref:cytoplasmic dynein 2 light intermediate chain 1-like n=1 Tax=Oppia nitens TaxID=1686743 RepID=UPI0023DC410F|nr:cytoplasmic dynein 2 light intermediate chain 1-like [Oppia nitens]
MSSQKKNIWDIAIQLSKSESQFDGLNGKSSLVVIGSKRGGKTSHIYRFIDKTDVPKPTIALEYMFCRKHINNETNKVICNIWELGGGVMFTNLIEFAINSEMLEKTSLLLAIDLSIPEEMIITTETLLNSIREHISNIIDKNLENILKDKAINRIGINHQDINQINYFPIPLVIIGTKFDVFQNLDPEKKKLIVRYLRIVCHSIGAQLIFVSTKSEALMTRIRPVLNALAFETTIDSLHFQSDYTKPIVIPFGSDSFQKIGYESIDAVKRMFTEIFPQMITQVVIPDDPAKDINFKERDIDLIRAQKDNELEDYRRQSLVKHNH